VGDRAVLVEVPDTLSLRDRIEFAVKLESAGFDGIALAEVTDPDSFVALALMAERTDRLSLATCVVQLGVRTAPSMAASAATLQTLSAGRFRLGLGVSSEAIVAGWHGREWTRPLVNARESLSVIREILSGGKTRHDGEVVRSIGFQLANTPDVPVPLHLAALNEGMVRLAAREADGVWLNYVPRHSAPELCALIDSAAAAGRPASRKLLTVFTEVTEDRPVARQRLRETLAFYMTSPAYRSALAWHGFEQEMHDARNAFEQRDKGGVMASITDQLIDSITCTGTAAQVRDGIEEYFAAGVDEISVAPLTAGNLDVTLKAAVGAVATAGA